MGKREEITLSTEHEQHIRAALEILQQAQYLINEAASQLCDVPGFGDEWSAAGKVHDTVKRYWYRVSGRRADLTRKRLTNILKDETDNG